jgi:hypothetical protein
MAVLAALAAGMVASGVGPSLTDAYGAPLWSQLEASAPSAGSSSGGSSMVVTYAEDVPCDPTPVAATGEPKTARARPPHKVRRRRIIHRVVVHRSAPVAPKPFPPKPMPIVHRPVVHRALLHRVVARTHRRRPHLARVAALAAPKRCVTLHSERLDGVGLLADSGPAAFAPPDATPDFGLGGGDSGGDSGFGGFGGFGGGGGGGGAFPNPVMGGGGGGGVTTGPGASGAGSGPISAAPEPQTWMLLILGVGLCGAALRRNRRTAAAA